MKAIINGRIITEDRIIDRKVILFNEKIVDLVCESDFDPHSVEEIIDSGGNYVSPGLIDLHIHGMGGFDTMDASFESLQGISMNLAKSGVTSFLPATMTMGYEAIKNCFSNIKDNMNRVEGARVLGCHMEGPFISKAFKGAQNEKDIIDPDLTLVQDYLDIIKIVTMAPEVDHDFKFIKRMKGEGILVSVGHSNGTFEETCAAIEAGISYSTHTFNAMRGLHHREPGVVGAVFSKDIFCEIIPDNIHVHRGFYETFIKINGLDRVILVSDCMRAGGLEDGLYELGGQGVNVKEGCARLLDGTLAGSVLKLLDGVKNVKENTSYSLSQIIKLATINPARAIGYDNIIGKISRGYFADIIIFDKDFDLKSTFIRGKTIKED